MERSGKASAAALALLALWSCESATDVQLLQIAGTGAVQGEAYLDANGDAVLDVDDSPLAGASVILTDLNQQGSVQQVAADTAGVFVLADVPIGTYVLTLDSAILGDSLVFVGASTPIEIPLADTIRIDLGATFPEVALEDVRTETPGRKVFTSGIALNPRQPFSDGEVFLRGASGYLRATNVERAGLATGDSVRLLGTVAVDNGHTTLDDVTPIVLVPSAAVPIPVGVSLDQAATADGGALDAALVRIPVAEITDTMTAPSGDFHYWVHSGPDSVEIVYRGFLGIPTAPIRPDTVVRLVGATGLLSPFDDGTGNVRWRLLPRATSEITVETKIADVAVLTSFDVGMADVGDTVEISVEISNSGTHTATDVVVDDPIPSRLTFLSATSGLGSYDDGTGLWSVGDLAPGAADTLRISAEVASSGIVTNMAQVTGLVREVDSDNTNDSSTADLIVP